MDVLIALIATAATVGIIIAAKWSLLGRGVAGTLAALAGGLLAGGAVGMVSWDQGVHAGGD